MLCPTNGEIFINKNILFFKGEKMTEHEAIARLQCLEGDSGISHGEADEILLLVLRSHGFWKLADEWEKMRKRVGFWYT